MSILELELETEGRRLIELAAHKKSPFSVKRTAIVLNCGDGGNRTPVRREDPETSTCVFCLLISPDGNPTDRTTGRPVRMRGSVSSPDARKPSLSFATPRSSADRQASEGRGHLWLGGQCVVVVGSYTACRKINVLATGTARSFKHLAPRRNQCIPGVPQHRPLPAHIKGKSLCMLRTKMPLPRVDGAVA